MARRNYKKESGEKGVGRNIKISISNSEHVLEQYGDFAKDALRKDFEDLAPFEDEIKAKEKELGIVDLKLSNDSLSKTRKGKKMKVGDKVLCTNDDYRERKKFPFHISYISKPQRGMVYTVREIVKTTAGTAVYLEEIVNVLFMYVVNGKYEMREPGFLSSRFRVVKKRVKKKK